MTPQIKQRLDQIQRGELPVGYKRTKAGVVPVEWEEKRIGDVLTQRKTLQCISIDAPLLSFTIEEGIIDPTDKKSNKRDFLIKDMATKKFALTEVGDIIYNPANLKFGAIHRNNLCRGVVSPIYGIFHGAQNSYFMGYLLHNQRFIDYAKIYTEGTVEKLKTLSADTFKKLKVTLPPLKEQDKIAEILSAQDKLIALKEKLIEEKKRQKKYLMQQLLTGKKRLPGFSDEWRKIKLSAVLIEGNKVAVVDTSMYRKMTVKLAFKGLEFTKTDREMADTRPFYVRKKNEIIIGKQNYFNGSVALVTDEFDGCICSNAIMSFGVKNANVKFILEYISQVDFMKKREMLANGTGQKELSEKEFLNFEIKLPCIEEQNHIGNIASTCDSEILLLQKNLDQEKQKKKALMQLLLTGIVRV